MRRPLALSAILSIAATLAVACSKQSTAPPESARSPATTPPGGTVSNTTAAPLTLVCDRDARSVEGNEGTSWFLRCPGCPDPARVWGTDWYTDDSQACGAAIHAGAITRAGGVALLTWSKGRPLYTASERHGIQSMDYGAWPRSFFVQAVGPDGRPTSPAPIEPPPGTVHASCTMTGDMIPDGSRVICPAACTQARLWGADVYTGDSPVCVAAVHAGLSTAERGGEMRLSHTGQHESFEASTRNGITSSAYPSYGSSFRLSR